MRRVSSQLPSQWLVICTLIFFKCTRLPTSATVVGIAKIERSSGQAGLDIPLPPVHTISNDLSADHDNIRGLSGGETSYLPASSGKPGPDSQEAQGFTDHKNLLQDLHLLVNFLAREADLQSLPLSTTPARRHHQNSKLASELEDIRDSPQNAQNSEIQNVRRVQPFETNGDRLSSDGPPPQKANLQGMGYSAPQAFNRTLLVGYRYSVAGDSHSGTKGTLSTRIGPDMQGGDSKSVEAYPSGEDAKDKGLDSTPKPLAGLQSQLMARAVRLAAEHANAFRAIGAPRKLAGEARRRLAGQMHGSGAASVGDESELRAIQRDLVLADLTFKLRAEESGTKRPESSQKSPPPFYSVYLAQLHMEALEVSEHNSVSNVLELLKEDPLVSGVFKDEIVGPFEKETVEPLSPDDENLSLSDALQAVEAGLRSVQQALSPGYKSPGGRSAGSKVQLVEQATARSSPDDPYLNRQWALQNAEQNPASMSAYSAWELWRGPLEVGENTVIALIDSGVDLTHPDLTTALWKNPGETDCTDGIDNDGNGLVDDCQGWDFVEDDNIPQDENGHGTASAGIIAAVPNNGVGMTPICWGCQVMNLKVLNANIRGTVSSFIKAINYALEKGVKISNNSYGGKGGTFPALQEAVNRAQRAGMIFVAASGNYADDNDAIPNPMYPASYNADNIVSVAAVTVTGQLASFSSYGVKSVALAAPGHKVLTSWINGGYREVSGTSFAVPHVTALVALIWSYDPTQTYKDVMQVLLGGVRKLEALKGLVSTGGVIDARRSLDLLLQKRRDKNAGQGVARPDSQYSSSPLRCRQGFETVKLPSGELECVDLNECLNKDTCPKLRGTTCINFPGTFECRCPKGGAWNGLGGTGAKCHVLEYPTSGPCVNNGPCGANSLCAVTSLTGRISPHVSCQCLPGYAKHPEGEFCSREGIYGGIGPEDYLSIIGLDATSIAKLSGQRSAKLKVAL